MSDGRITRACAEPRGQEEEREPEEGFRESAHRLPSGPSHRFASPTSSARRAVSSLTTRLPNDVRRYVRRAPADSSSGLTRR
jgi:hypothetical protein